MANLIDFASVEVPANTQSLPLPLAAGTETLLTSVFLNIANTSAKVVIRATVAWQPQLLAITPQLNIRIRRGGFTPAFPEVYNTTDSAFLGTGGLITDIITTSIVHYETPDPTTVGTFQQYFLTVTSTGLGGITIVGPVSLVGEVIG